MTNAELGTKGLNTSSRNAGLMRTFDAALHRLKAELQKNLDQIDVLDRRRLKAVLELFNQRLIIAQYEFMELLARTVGEPGTEISELELREASPGMLAEVASTILAGGGAAAAVQLISITTVASSWYFWTTTTTVSVATIAGGALGVSAIAATAGTAALAGIAGAFIASKLTKGRRRDKVRTKIISQFDSDVVPKLNAWARDRIAGLG
jgi:hypothetical protein